MVIDKETTAQTDISLSVDFPLLVLIRLALGCSIPCDFLQVGYRDALGNDRSDIDNEIFKTSLDVNGNLIGNRDKSSVYHFPSSHLDHHHRSHQGGGPGGHEARRHKAC